ncbi:MAG TPA: glycosyltransferase [Gemmatimonadales bacterium]|nr:glycosyltransferase [Gemmatimonadales bacterium]
MSSLSVVHLSRGREWRGGERQVRLLVQTLATRGVEQSLITARGSILAREVAGGGPPPRGVPWRTAWDPRALAGTLRHIRRIRAARQPGLVLHAHDSHALAVALAAAGWFRLPVVATRRSVTTPGRLWRKPIRVIALSRAVETALLAAGVPPERIVQVPSAVALETLAQVRPAAELPTNPRGPRLVVAVGALTREKGHHLLIEAQALVQHALPDALLAIIGDGPERRRLEALARRHGLADRVRFLGARPDATALMAAAGVLAQPSVREALGTTVLEAMALGIPVVSSGSGGLVELLAGGAGVLVPPDDPPALAAALIRVLTDQELRRATIRTARARVREYDALGVADRVVAVYRSALATH